MGGHFFAGQAWLSPRLQSRHRPVAVSSITHLPPHALLVPLVKTAAHPCRPATHALAASRMPCRPRASILIAQKRHPQSGDLKAEKRVNTRRRARPSPCSSCSWRRQSAGSRPAGLCLCLTHGRPGLRSRLAAAGEATPRCPSHAHLWPGGQ